MALKDDIKEVRQDLNTEEQFLENFIKSELFVKKYKKPIIFLAVVLVFCFSFYQISNYFENKKIEKANQLYIELLSNPNDEILKNQLKNSDINLFALYDFRVEMDKNDTKKMEEISNLPIDPILKEIIKFQANEGDSSVIMSDYSHFIKGFKLLKENKIDIANSEFAKIDPNSKLQSIIKNLQHYHGSKNEK